MTNSQPGRRPGCSPPMHRRERSLMGLLAVEQTERDQLGDLARLLIRLRRPFPAPKTSS